MKANLSYLIGVYCSTYSNMALLEAGDKVGVFADIRNAMDYSLVAGRIP